MSSPPFDVIVIGSGAGGMTAAITAAQAGRSVLILEKAGVVGGTTAWSGGAAWIPNNHHMQSVGEADSPERAAAYIQAVLGNHYDAAMADAFVTHGAEAIRFLEQNSRWIRFVSYAGSDYHPDLPGAATKARSLLPIPFDGRRLGRQLKLLRRPKSEMTVFDGMQIETTEIRHLQNVFRSPTAFWKSLKLLGRYAVDRVRYGRGTRMIRGTALAAAMLQTALDHGVRFETGVTVRRLLRDQERVVGVEVSGPQGRQTLLATSGIVLATGGASANGTVRSRTLPDPDNHLLLLPEENTGDGLSLAREAGAALGPSGGSNAIFAPASRRILANGDESVYPHFAFDRCKPGSLLVDTKGHRFVNEAESYHTLVKRMHDLRVSPAWLIGDHVFLRKYGMGLARAAPYPYRRFVREGYLVKAASLEGLADRIGVNQAGLLDSVARMNLYADTGVDVDFGKGSDIYTRALGDPENRPNPCLGPVRTGPFYALALWPTDVGTSLGLNINADGAVLDSSGNAIPGLFAAGLDAHAALRGFYPGAGTQIGQAIAFGYAAGKALANT